MSIVISAFPGMGKTYASKSFKLNIIDLDSSSFKWVVNDGKQKITNPDFPNNYILEIKKILDQEMDAVVFVSSHSEVRDALRENKIYYFLIAPYQNEREYLVNRYRKRGNSERFCKTIYDNWYNYTDSINNETWPTLIKLGEEQFITEELLNNILHHSSDMLENTTKLAKTKSDMKDIIDSDPRNYLFWSILSRKRNFTASDLSAYSEYIDWDILCKFNKLGKEFFKYPDRYKKFVNWRYLEKNSKKYSLSERKVISNMVKNL